MTQKFNVRHTVELLSKRLATCAASLSVFNPTRVCDSVHWYRSDPCCGGRWTGSAGQWPQLGPPCLNRSAAAPPGWAVLSPSAPWLGYSWTTGGQKEVKLQWDIDVFMLAAITLFFFSPHSEALNRCDVICHNLKITGFYFSFFATANFSLGIKKTDSLVRAGTP